MSFLVHIIVMSLFVTSIISQSHQRCLWWQRPCKTTTNRPMLVRYCDTWCEYPIGSGRFKCCDQVPDPTTTETPKCKFLVDMNFHIYVIYIALKWIQPILILFPK